MSNNVKVDDLSVGIRLQQKDSLLMVLTVIELWRVELRNALDRSRHLQQRSRSFTNPFTLRALSYKIKWLP